ncbi:MAG: molecular chaperone Hsp33 [Pseudohongiellaceae bacterium]|jgi:molecular chaperone Hsp33
MTIDDITDNDLLHKFIFDDTDLRGEIVTLNDSLDEMLANQAYPTSVKQLLGEFMAAVALLSSTLKFDGILTLQARGDGPLPLIMAEVSNSAANSNKQLRCVAKLAEANEGKELLLNSGLPNLIGKGILSIIIDPTKGNRYQGIVPLEEPCLADCLQHYFAQSEQLPTRLWLASDGTTATGLMLQQLPQQEADTETNQQAWINRIQLANTITENELLSLPHELLLTRLFHEEGVRIFEPTGFDFNCSCSKERSSSALKHLGQADAEALLEEQGTIIINCEFCGFEYRYDTCDISELFGPDVSH